MVLARCSQNLTSVSAGRVQPCRTKTGDASLSWESILSPQKLMCRSVMGRPFALALMTAAAQAMETCLEARMNIESTIHANEY